MPKRAVKVYFSAKELQLVDRLCKLLDQDRSSVLRELILEFLPKKVLELKKVCE